MHDLGKAIYKYAALGGGQVVSLLTFYSNDQSLNPDEVYSFCFFKIDWKEIEWSKKRPRWPNHKQFPALKLEQNRPICWTSNHASKYNRNKLLAWVVKKVLQYWSLESELEVELEEDDDDDDVEDELEDDELEDSFFFLFSFVTSEVPL